jgi:HK97 family phage major capsid protein
MDYSGVEAAVARLENVAREQLAKTAADVKDLRTALDKVELKLNRPGLVGIPRNADGDLDRKRAALGRFCKSGDDTGLREIKSMEVGVDPSGGWLVLPTVSNQMTRKCGTPARSGGSPACK